MTVHLMQVLGQLEADPEVRGVIWASGLQRDVFTAGNDMKELHAPSTSRERHHDFWIAQVWPLLIPFLIRLPSLARFSVHGAT